MHDRRTAFMRHISANERALRGHLSATMYQAIRDTRHGGNLVTAWHQWMAVLQQRLSAPVFDDQRQAASYIVLLLKAHPDDARAEFTWRFRREVAKGLPEPVKQRGLPL